MQTEVDKLVGRTKVAQFREKLDEALSQYDEPALKEIDQEFKAKVEEELTTSDWTKLGAITGLLWYKFDMIINHLKGLERAADNIDRNTARIK